MKKVFIFLLSLSILVSTFSSLAVKAYAAPCVSIASTNGEKITTDTQKVNLKIAVNLKHPPDPDTYEIRLNGQRVFEEHGDLKPNDGSWVPFFDWVIDNQRDVSFHLNTDSSGSYLIVPNLLVPQTASTYNLEVVSINGDYLPNNESYCSGPLIVEQGTSNGSGQCSIDFDGLGNTFQDDDSLIGFKIKADSQGRSLPVDGTYDIVVNRGAPGGPESERYTNGGASLATGNPVFLSPLSPGLYSVLVKLHGSSIPGLGAGTIFDSSQVLCSQYLQIAPKCPNPNDPSQPTDPTLCAKGGPISVSDVYKPPANPAPCIGKWVDSTGKDDPKGGICSSVSSGLGFDIPTDPSGFAKRAMGAILGIAGGIALLIIIITGYKVLTSQGDPERLKGAREALTSAIVGLLFIIFSLVVLQIATVDILHIPGFEGSTSSSQTSPTSAKTASQPVQSELLNPVEHPDTAPENAAKVKAAQQTATGIAGFLQNLFNK